MAARIVMPSFGMYTVEGEVAAWLVAPGSEVAPGQPIIELSTDKASFEIEAPAGGRFVPVARLGQVVAIEGLIALVLEPAESAEAALAAALAPAAGAADPPPATPAAAGPRAAPPDREPGGERVNASPIARRLAVEVGVDLAGVAGSGPHGRILEADVRAAAERGEPSGSPAPESPGGAESRSLAIDPRELAYRMRKDCVRMTAKANSSHIGSALSTVDLLAVLFAKHLRFDAKRPDWPERDRFILSKGHGCAALYSILAEAGYFDAALLMTYYEDGSPFVGHATHTGVPGVEVSTGSLGHGLSIAAGMALAHSRDGGAQRTICMLSDGECDEGSVWEAALFAAHHRLDNLVAIVDHNKIQSFGSVAEVLDLAPLADKWRSFGWGVRELDGHDLPAIDSACAALPFEPGKPSVIVAHTVKGKGVSFMEGELLWHYRAPRGELEARALAEIEAAYAAGEAGGAK